MRLARTIGNATSGFDGDTVQRIVYHGAPCPAAGFGRAVGLLQSLTAAAGSGGSPVPGALRS